MIGSYCISYIFHQYSLTCFRLCNDKCTLSFSDWSKKINYTG